MNEGTPVTNPDGTPRTLQDVFDEIPTDSASLAEAINPILAEVALEVATYPDGEPVKESSVDLEDADMELIVAGLHAISGDLPGTEALLEKLGFA